MSKTLDALALAELLPSSISGDRQVGSAAQAIDPELHAVADFARTLPILSRIDELPEELIDEDTGELLDSELTTIGTVTVTEVKEKIAYTTPLEGATKGMSVLPAK